MTDRSHQENGSHQGNESLQRIVLACRKDPREREDVFQSRVDELIGLCDAAGGEVTCVCSQARQDIDAGLYLGSGKISEVGDKVVETEADIVVFGGELTPGQVRNLENRLSCRVIDRTQLILDIFALRANSREGRLQVEIAQLQYLLPRLTGRGVAMSRLGGGIGTRGPGETKLETDRRRIRERVSHLKTLLQQVQKTRATQRARREKTTPVVALVGYTNAGKSTLLQRWTADRGEKTEVRGHNRLFDTLDPLARRVRSGPKGEIVLLDTVGFVQNLPHLLVDAFRATLEEVLAADLIVHVVDGADAEIAKLTTTYQVLSEIGAVDKPVVTFYNKMDLAPLNPPPDVRAVCTLYGSAETGINMDALYREVERQLGLDPIEVVVRGPASIVLSHDVSKHGLIVSVQGGEQDDVEATLAVARNQASALVHIFKQQTGVDVEWRTQP